MQKITKPSVQIIWAKSHITVDQKPTVWDKPIAAGLMSLDQLYDNGKLISVKSANQRFRLSFLQFYGIVTAIPKGWKRILEAGKEEPHEVKNIVVSQYKIVSYAYSRLTYDNTVTAHKHKKWEQAINPLL